MAKLGERSHFAHPLQLMGYSAAVSREHSSSERIRRGAISKAGNAHPRRIVVEAAWVYWHRPAVVLGLIRAIGVQVEREVTLPQRQAA